MMMQCKMDDNCWVDHNFPIDASTVLHKGQFGNRAWLEDTNMYERRFYSTDYSNSNEFDSLDTAERILILM